MNSKSKIIISICILLLSLISLETFGQEMSSTNLLPVYPGGVSALKKLISENLHYPDKAVAEGVAGVVEVEYTIDKQGKVRDIKVIHGISPECDAEAIRVTGIISAWSPGLRMGKPVEILVKMPVEFKSGKNLPPVTITGKVTDMKRNIPVEGAYVIIRGTNIGTITNADGSYRLEVSSENQYLEFIATGYTTIVESIDNHKTINVDLNPEYLVIDFNKP